MDRCDVLIVGGGPAGSTCARQLVRRGLQVVVIDRARFPRGKTCAGWITPQVVECLELDLADYARQRTLQPYSGFLIGSLGGETRHIRYGDTVSYGIRRLEFDHYLLQRSGARIEEGTSLHSAVRTAQGWEVNGRWQARWLVGAGGHGCPVARLMGSEVGRADHAFCAREAEFLMDRQLALNCRVGPTQGELYFCTDLAGYGWCLRKGNYLNIGLGREGPANLAADLDRLLHRLIDSGRVPLAERPRFRGHAYLSWEASRRPLTAAGCLLVGDAAGVASARSGEGIRRAVESGVLAGAALAGAMDGAGPRAFDTYAAALFARWGPRRGPRPPPGALRRTVARRLLSNPPFLRHLVLDRYFLQRTAPALHAMGPVTSLEQSP